MRNRQRNRDAVQNVKPIQRLFADEARTEQTKARIASVGDHVDAPDRQAAACPGPSWPKIGVARAMFEPTVMAQIAN